MSIDRFFTTAATVATPTTATADAEGVPTVSTATATVSVHVQPYTAQAGEQVLGVQEAERARRIWLPAGTTITARSTITVGAEVFEVRGDPKPWTVGSAQDHIAVVAVRSIR